MLKVVISKFHNKQMASKSHEQTKTFESFGVMQIKATQLEFFRRITSRCSHKDLVGLKAPKS